jgi:hypothetical protein
MYLHNRDHARRAPFRNEALQHPHHALATPIRCVAAWSGVEPRQASETPGSFAACRRTVRMGGVLDIKVQILGRVNTLVPGHHPNFN